MRKKIQGFILILVMLFATIDFVYEYVNHGTLNLFYLGSIYLVSGIGLNALYKAE